MLNKIGGIRSNITLVLIIFSVIMSLILLLVILLVKKDLSLFEFLLLFFLFFFISLIFLVFLYSYFVYYIMYRVDSIGEAFYIITHNGKVIWYSRKACEMFGFCKENEESVNLCKYCPFGFSSFYSCNLRREALINKVARGYFDLEKKGKIYHLMLTMVPIDVLGIVIGFVVFLTDVTELRLLQKRLEELIRRDALTGIYNRRILDDEVKTLIDIANRYDRPLSVLLFDIDNFKRVNDLYGHEVGNIVLKELARIVHKRLRATDIFCRLGGEEFLVVLPETDLNRAITVAEDIRRAVESYQYFPVGKITISVGVTTFSQGDNVNTLISRADNAMYRAKNMGKNRVCVL